MADGEVGEEAVIVGDAIALVVVRPTVEELVIGITDPVLSKSSEKWQATGPFATAPTPAEGSGSGDIVMVIMSVTVV